MPIPIEGKPVFERRGMGRRGALFFSSLSNRPNYKSSLCNFGTH